MERVMEVGESSTPSPNLPLTRDLVERTIPPPLVAPMERHDRNIRDWVRRHGKLEGYMLERLELKIFATEPKAIKNEQDIAMMQDKIDMIESEAYVLRTKLDESKETVKAMEEYIDLLEQRIEIVEERYARNEEVRDALNRMVQAHLQVQKPPSPSPPQ